MTKGNMTVNEAGRKGGKVTAERHGTKFFQEIGQKGGAKIRELIKEGKTAMENREKAETK